MHTEKRNWVKNNILWFLKANENKNIEKKYGWDIDIGINEINTAKADGIDVFVNYW